jgi:type I restriction enzyme, S subunit
MNGSLPLGWITDKLGNLVSFKTGKLNSNAATPNGKYPFFTCSQQTFKTDTYSFDTECVLLGGNNANGIYPLKYYSGKFDAYQRTYVIRSINPNKLKNRYLYYALQLKLDLLRSISTGAATKFLTLTILTDIGLEVPPPHIQDKIAGILSAYDRLIENNTRRIEILEEMARSIYREWFVKFRFPGHEQVQMVDSELGLIPEGWEVGRLDDALILQRGFDLPTQQRKEGNIPIYASTGVTGTHNEAKVKAPGVVTGRSGSLGTVIYIDEDFWPLNTTLWVKEFRRVTPLYAFYLLSDLKLEQYNSGAAVPTLNRNDIHGRRVVIPPQKILEQLNQFVEPLLVLKKNLLKRSDNLRQTRDLLLPRLISGEIDVENLDINTGPIAA